MVDTLALGASGGNPVEVQVLSRAPVMNCCYALTTVNYVNSS